MTTYDVVRVRHDVLRRRTTSSRYVTYDVALTISYVYILYIARHGTTSHVRYTTRCRMSHVQCRTTSTSCTYDIVRTYDIVGGKNPDGLGVKLRGQDDDVAVSPATQAQARSHFKFVSICCGIAPDALDEFPLFVSSSALKEISPARAIHLES
jgi:hypothetical protein